MNKNIFNVTFLCLLLCSVICFAVPPQPTDQSKFSENVPAGATPPNPTYITSKISKPYPTNKFFNSVINAAYDSHYSLNMYTYPQSFRAEQKGLLIQYPKMQYFADKIIYKDFESGWNEWGYWQDDGDKCANALKIEISTTTSNGYNIAFDSTKLDGYSDFAATMKWEKNSHSMTSTIVQGSPFSYYEFSEGMYPSINFPYNWDDLGAYWHNGIPGYTLYDINGSSVPAETLSYGDSNTDRILLQVHTSSTTAEGTVSKTLYYGIFVPKGTKFSQDPSFIADPEHWYVPWIKISIEFPSGNNNRYMAIALLPSTSSSTAKTDMDEYYKYAYNFVTNTEADWSVNLSDYSSTTQFKFITTQKRTDVPGQQAGTMFCLFPHQYEEINSNDKTFESLRGTLKLSNGTSFSVRKNFKGIIPFFQFNSNDLANIKGVLSEYLESDNNNTTVDSIPTNSYHGGKVLAKLANMLPIADNLNDTITKKSIITKLNYKLSKWFKYSSQTEEYFAYDKTWGGFIGINNAYGSERYNDHHFHYGYFIYAAAILAMYDTDFVRNYGQMVNLLIKDIANTDRKDKNFPFFRYFDFYESHSWANGMGGGDNFGIDQESSSEAMNAWSAIYLWGLVTGNKDYEKLGIYLYSNEYEAIKYYYFDIPEKILKKGNYNHNSIGRLFGGKIDYDLFFYPKYPETIKGIQVLPMTPAMTYLSYDKTYIEKFYNATSTESGSKEDQWYDIWARLIALYNPTTALDKFNKYKENVDAEEGSSKSFTYYFINFFDKYGIPVFDYSANQSSYMVLDKNGTKTYCAYNPSNSSKNIMFYNSSKEPLGYLYVPRNSFVLSQKLSNNIITDKISVYPVPYKPNSGGRYGGNGIYFTNVTEGTNLKIFNIAGEKVFETTIEEAGDFLWNAKNNSGNNIASGIYFYYIKTSDGKKVKGKLAIER